MKFSIKDAFKKAWEVGKENVGVLVGLTSIIFIVFWILGVWQDGIDKSLQVWNPQNFIIYVSAYILTALIAVVAQIGYIKILFKIYDGGEANPKDIFSYYSLAWYFIVASILYEAIVLFGILLLIVPGIFFAVKYGYYSYCVIDKNLKPVDALKESANITAGNRWKLFLFAIVAVGVNILGALFLGFGLIVSIPLTTLASIHVFRFLSNGQTLPEQGELALEK